MDRRIEQLQTELQTLVSGLPAFAEGAFSIFDLEDLKHKTTMQMPPVVGITYDGAIPVQANQGVASDFKSGNARLITFQFSVIIGIQYIFAGQDDTKPVGMNLLDEIRETVEGYKGVNNRPWVWAGEKPEDDVSSDGLIFYSQVWRTNVVKLGATNN